MLNFKKLLNLYQVLESTIQLRQLNTIIQSPAEKVVISQLSLMHNEIKDWLFKNDAQIPTSQTEDTNVLREWKAQIAEWLKGLGRDKLKNYDEEGALGLYSRIYNNIKTINVDTALPLEGIIWPLKAGTRPPLYSLLIAAQQALSSYEKEMERLAKTAQTPLVTNEEEKKRTELTELNSRMQSLEQQQFSQSQLLNQTLQRYTALQQENQALQEKAMLYEEEKQKIAGFLHALAVGQNGQPLNLGHLPKETAETVIALFTQLKQTLQVETPQITSNAEPLSLIMPAIPDLPDKYKVTVPAKSEKVIFNEWKTQNPNQYRQHLIQDCVSLKTYMFICDLIEIINSKEDSFLAPSSLEKNKAREIILIFLSLEHWNKTWSERTSCDTLKDLIQSAPQKIITIAGKINDSTIKDKVSDAYTDSEKMQIIGKALFLGEFLPKDIDLGKEFSTAVNTAKSLNINGSNIPKT